MYIKIRPKNFGSLSPILRTRVAKSKEKSEKEFCSFVLMTIALVHGVYIKT